MPAILNHPSFIQPDDPAIRLWRYMDLSKFASLLQRRVLVFARADTLGDPFEGSIPVPNAEALKTILALRKLAPEHDPYPGMSDDKVTTLHENLSGARRRMTKAYYINCWHMNEAESAAMWRLYSRSSDAVCIQTNYTTLSDALPESCHLGIVKYIDFKTTPINAGNLFNAYLVKRRSFAHEREARAIFTDFSSLKGADSPSLVEIAVDLNELIKGIYISPDAPDWFRDVVADLTDKYGLSVPVEHSEINAVPLY